MNVTADGATIRRATPEDAAAIERLLVAAGLPPDGVREALRGFAVVPDGAMIVAAAGLERYDDAVLLRSVVVAPEARGAGLGRRLVEERLALAASRGATAAYLLTTTAEAFFSHLGFAPVDREHVPAGVRASAEFASLCPAGATAMHRAISTADSGRPAVLFLCTHNAGRSQMAAGWLRRLAGSAVDVFSGGSAPAAEVNPGAAAAMGEVGIDLTGVAPQPWTETMLEAADVIVTMGCGDACPVLPGKRYVDWPVPDPAGRPVEEIRPIRDDIGRRVRGLLDELGVPIGGAADADVR